MLLEIRRDIANSFPTSQFQREAELTTPKNLISDYDIGKIDKTSILSMYRQLADIRLSVVIAKIFVR